MKGLFCLGVFIFVFFNLSAKILRNRCMLIKLSMSVFPWYRKWIERRKHISPLKGPVWFYYYTAIGAMIAFVYLSSLEIIFGVSISSWYILEIIGVLASVSLILMGIILLNYLYPPPPCEDLGEERNWIIDPERKAIFTLLALVEIFLGIIGLVCLAIFKKEGI